MDPLRLVHTSSGEVPEIEARPQDADRDDAASRAKFNKLMSWLEHERDRQAENRAEMAIDADYYDGLQWSEEDALEVESRGQAPLVFNEVKVSIDWIVGAEKRNRVDWRVLPREESDMEGATVRSKVLKYLSDVNRIPYMRSKAFSEAVISGLSWLEDGLSMDATDDVLYGGHESWRNVLHDSYHKSPDGKDMRYLFRWRYIDLDVAKALWPEHAEALERTAANADQLAADADDELWYLGANLRDPQRSSSTTRHLASTGSSVESDRRRVKVYEAWYKEPQQAEILYGGAYHGDLYNPSMPAHQRAMQEGASDVVKAIVLRARVAFMTDAELLGDWETPFAHNQFPLTPVYCFRRGRDGMPYGHVRPMRDPQMDLNKRMSKSLFLLSVNQLITERSAFSSEKDGYTLQDAIDNVSNPQGVFVLERGDAKFEIRRDFAEIRGHAEILALDRQFLQSASGVTDELLGRRTNATSGAAITARQEQGSIATSGVFDNYRLAISVSGQKALSNVEKFYSMPKVIRLTEAQVGEETPNITWVKINQPELQPDGQVRFLNDITQSKADFVVDEMDYRATMRQAMFDQLMDMLKIIAPIAPPIAVGMLDLIVDANDFPGKEQLIQRVRQLLAEAKGELKSPEQKAAEAEAEALAKRAAAAKIAVDESKADKTDAEADQLRTMLAMTIANPNPDYGDGEGDNAGEPRSMAPAAGGPAAVPPAAPTEGPPSGAASMPMPAPAAAPAAPDDATPALEATLEAVTAALEQGQRVQAMVQQQAAMASQQTAMLRQEMMQAMGQLASLLANGGKPAPKSKVIRVAGPEGKPITARVEYVNGQKVITMDGADGRFTQATIEEMQE